MEKKFRVQRHNAIKVMEAFAIAGFHPRFVAEAPHAAECGGWAFVNGQEVPQCNCAREQFHAVHVKASHKQVNRIMAQVVR